jgi:SulP family sulfate permease
MKTSTPLARHRIELHISGMKLPVETVLRNAGALEENTLLHMYRTDVDTLLAFGRLSP